MRHDNESYIITIKRQADTQTVKDACASYSTDGRPAPAHKALSTAQRTQAPTPAIPPAAAQAPAAVTAPLPGIIIDLKVKPGDTVREGQELAILEAMKMENSIESPRPGTVRTINVSVGETISEGKVLITLE